MQHPPTPHPPPVDHNDLLEEIAEHEVRETEKQMKLSWFMSAGDLAQYLN